jgi:prepilin-type N-terminal cleavage/methylation domain-containing protein
MPILNDPKRRNSGFSLIESVITMSVLSIIGVASVHLLTPYMRTNLRADQDQERALIRDFVRKNLDCEETYAALTAADCAPGRYIDAFDGQGRVLASKTQRSRIGTRHMVRVSCPNGPNQLLIEAMRVKELENATVDADRNSLSSTTQQSESQSMPGIADRDPITGTPSNWRDLFNGIPVFAMGATGNTIDFEDIPGARDGLTFGAEQANFLRSRYGIRLRSIEGGEFRLARIVDQDEPEPLFEAWMSILCPGRPNHNRQCGGTNTSGRWALSVADATDTRRIEFEIIYDSPVRQLSFDILDLDGGEDWFVTPYDESGVPIRERTGGVEEGGYGVGSTGNSASTRFEIRSSARNIAKVRLVGTKGIRIFGFGFDNFHTGRSVCSFEP